jgi:hypothetical protein
MRSRRWVMASFMSLPALRIAAARAQGSGDDFNGPSRSGGNDTAHVPYTPPADKPPPVLRAPEPGDGEEPRDAPEHDPEDRETERRSQGEGSGQDEPTPEPGGE